MPDISVIVPTVAGREHSLERTLAAYKKRSDGAQVELIVLADRPACGVAWQQGARKAQGDYLHFTADDLEPHEGWWPPLVAACDDGDLPCPVVLNPDGSVQSAGGDMSAPECLLKNRDAAGEQVQFAPVPFLAWWQWIALGAFVPPIHYCTDLWISVKGRKAGLDTVLTPASVFTHHNETAGRGAGMDQGSRSHHDHRLFRSYLAEVA